MLWKVHLSNVLFTLFPVKSAETKTGNSRRCLKSLHHSVAWVMSCSCIFRHRSHDCTLSATTSFIIEPPLKFISRENFFLEEETKEQKISFVRVVVFVFILFLMSWQQTTYINSICRSNDEKLFIFHVFEEYFERTAKTGKKL